MSGVGRFAPSPTGDLHLGNLRTALVAWLAARAHGAAFIVRMEDLDRVTSSREHEDRQLASLRQLGIDWDGPVIRQSDRFTLYDDALATLASQDCVYPCYCTRREIREAISAPHNAPSADGAYPGTCRELSTRQRDELESLGRRPALRLRTEGQQISFHDDLNGTVTAAVDDVVLRRNDGVPAYNLAVVVDDALQGVSEVVRGDDLLLSTPRQILLQRLLGLPTPRYCHVPLVLNADGDRLAKRDGAVTLPQLQEAGASSHQVLRYLAASIGLSIGPHTSVAAELVSDFDIGRIPREPLVYRGDLPAWNPVAPH